MNKDILEMMLVAERIELETMIYPDTLSALGLGLGDDTRIASQVKAWINHMVYIGEADEIDAEDHDFHHIRGGAWSFEAPPHIRDYGFPPGPLYDALDIPIEDYRGHDYGLD